MNLEQQLVHARQLRNSGRTQAAEKVYKRLLKLRPKHVQANRDYGLLARDMRQPQVAERFLGRALSLVVEDSQAHEALGDVLAEQNKLHEAVSSFTQAVRRSETPSPELLCKLGDVLRRTGDTVGAERAFKDALKVAPESHFAHVGLGDVFRYQGRFVEALRCYSAASAVNPASQLPGQRMKTVFEGTCQPWHFPMMQDQARNDAFQAAINRVVKPGDVVLDIGCGSGLLSMMAARAGASRVIACDDHPTICEAAKMIVAQNGLSDRVSVVNQRSTDLMTGADLPKADVLICEVFDVGVFGEDALHTIRHAFSHLLKPDAKIIPGGVRVWATPVTSDALRSRFRVGTTNGFDLSAFNVLSDPRVFQLDLSRYDYTPLSAPATALELDFGPDLGLMGSQGFSVVTEAAGRLDGFIFWYELILGDGVTLSTEPTETGTHWLQGFLPYHGEDKHITAGERLQVSTEYRRYLMWFDLVQPGGALV